MVDNRVMRYLPALLLLANAAPLRAQFNTKLQPQTIEEFDRYARNVERQPFPSGENASDREKVLNGELFIHPGTPDNPVAISDGLIHDWVGTVFIPHTTVQKVRSVLQDFGRHSQIYPNIVDSRLIQREGNNLVGYWRVKWKYPPLTVVLDIQQEAHWREVAPGKWVCHAYAKNISEVENAGTPREKKLPPGVGKGFLWRLYAYWSLEAVNGGVLAECRTLSLSRAIPPALAWAINPFVQSLPRESLAGTLGDTRNAATK